MPGTGLPNQVLGKHHNAMHCLFTKKNISTGVLLTTCKKQLSFTWNAGAEKFVYPGVGAELNEASNNGQ